MFLIYPQKCVATRWKFASSHEKWLMFPPVSHYSGPHLQFEDEVEALQIQVDKLETLGYNKIIALGHSGFDVDQDIAKRVRGIDVVIGGHTNTFLYTGSSILLLLNSTL